MPIQGIAAASCKASGQTRSVRLNDFSYAAAVLPCTKKRPSGVGSVSQALRAVGVTLQITQPFFYRILIKCAPHIMLVDFSRHPHCIWRRSGAFLAEPSLGGKIHYKGSDSSEAGWADCQRYRRHGVIVTPAEVAIHHSLIFASHVVPKLARKFLPSLTCLGAELDVGKSASHHLSRNEIAHDSWLSALIVFGECLCYFEANGQPHSIASARIIIALELSVLRLGCSLMNLITTSATCLGVVSFGMQIGRTFQRFTSSPSLRLPCRFPIISTWPTIYAMHSAC